MEPLVVVENLVKIYRDGSVGVDNVSFEAGKGITMLMGPNGSGKTTTMSIIAGALAPTRGSVGVCGYEVWGSGWEEARECIGFAPQDMPFRMRLTVMENLVWYGLLRGLGMGEAKRRGLELLEALGLLEHRGKKVQQLSGGMRKKLSIAAAMMGDPRVLILDEPTSGLDPAARRELWRIIRGLAEGRVVLASTHIAEDAEENADRVLIFHRGRIVAEGRPLDLIREHAGFARIRIRGLLRDPPPSNGEYRLLKLSDGEAWYLTRDPDTVLPRIIEVLINNNSSIELVEVKKPGLAEVYLHLTGVELGERVEE